MGYSPLLAQLIESLRCLPGVGPKTAQRMAFQLLNNDRDGAKQLARVLDDAVEQVGHCEQCRMLTEKPLCDICASTKRDRTRLCIVETPADVLAVEQAVNFDGHYFVLMGHLSPLDGVGPEQLGLPLLKQRCEKTTPSEVILATNHTVEGEATAHVIADLAHRFGIATTRIAHGVPVGGELEYTDRGTLSHAFAGRVSFD